MRDLVARTGVDFSRVQRLCAAIGMPVPGWTEVAFSERDLQALEWVTEVVDYGVLTEGTELSLLRAISHTAERLAWWQFETLVDDAAQRFELDDASARLVVLDRIADLADVLEEQMIYAWRRHLAQTIRWIGQNISDARHGQGLDPTALPLARAVGFADLVNYTEVSEHLSAGELASLVQEFENTTRGIVTRGGGRVVKTIGDAMMFVTDDPSRAALICLDLAENIGRSGATPPARVAMVWGRVLARFGDVFGPTVNLASRLSELAGPGEVFVDEPTAFALSDEEEVSVVAQEACTVAGIGEVFPYRLVRPGIS
jgi:adenylate cyclase